MHASPDELRLDRFFGRIRRRLLLLRAIEGAASGCIVAALLAVFVEAPVLSAVIVILATIARVLFGDDWRFGWWRSNSALAVRAERRTDAARNLIVTAAELLEASPDRTDYVPSLVVRRAAAVSVDIAPAALFPARNATAALAIGALLLLVALAIPDFAGTRPAARLTSSPGLPAIERLDVTVTPPSYSGLPATTLVNPTRIETLAGSRISLQVESSSAEVQLEMATGAQPVNSSGGLFTASVTAQTDGYIALEPRDSAGTRGPRHLIGLVVTPDRPPRVSLTSPGRDLFFSDVPSSIPVALNAEDDLALGTLKLRYTAVSGSGERFTFIERDVPVTLSQTSSRAWTATGTWRLDSLALAPGDLVVYRAVATDQRPGSAPVESDSYVLEVVTPGAIAAEGFAADDERDRYAVSQQMVILKTERLIARRASLPPDSISDAARLLAAEQRQVRAEFVFMMGGELEDAAIETSGTLEVNEEAEAEAEGDMLAGRLQNQGRIEMMRAIRFMSRASTSLTDVSLEDALRNERMALDNLMRAFARTRFILRALTLRERIDLDRRLSGSLPGPLGLSARAASMEPHPRVVALRRLMADVAALAGDSARVSATRAVDGAIALLRSDPGSDTIRVLAERIQQVARDATTRQAPRTRQQVDSLVRTIARLAATSLPPAPAAQRSLGAARVDGAWRDARRLGRMP